jgi:carbonic anhydrase
MRTSIAQITPETDLTEIRALLAEYMAWTESVEGKARDAPTFQDFDTELATLPGVYAAPAGRFFIARVDGRLAGCVAIKPHDGGVCELKRLYVRPEFRRQGLGERLARRAIDEARAIGYQRMILDSHISMTSAHAIYRALGFRDIEAPNGFPERFKPYVVFMEMSLPSLSR